MAALVAALLPVTAPAQGQETQNPAAQVPAVQAPAGGAPVEAPRVNAGDEAGAADLAAQLDLLPHLSVLAIAYLFALPIGWNREREERSAGLRTFPL